MYPKYRLIDLSGSGTLKNTAKLAGVVFARVNDKNESMACFEKSMFEKLSPIRVSLYTGPSFTLNVISFALPNAPIKVLRLLLLLRARAHVLFLRFFPCIVTVTVPVRACSFPIILLSE